MTVVHRWLTEPLPHDVCKALERLERAPGVRRIAVMPDVHLAEHVCVGTVVATDGVVYPQAVGGDIGCGMATVRLLGNDGGDVVVDEPRAERLLAELRERVPIVRRRSPQDVSLSLSSARLQRRVERDARVQLGTVGRGNHFVELQRDDDGALWLAVHSGSRGLGPAVRAHHLRGAEAVGSGLLALRGDDAAAYRHDHDAALAYAERNRRELAANALAAMHDVLGLRADEASWFDVTHNFVRDERHGGEPLLVHRKGACSARDGERGLIPGSMGAHTFHVEGRGCAAALASSSHGAGRCLARGEAMRRVSVRQLEQDLDGVFFERRLGDRLRDEAPRAYKDIGRVMRAQRELVRVVRRLRPVLVFKGA